MKNLFVGRAGVVRGRAEMFLSELHSDLWEVFRELLDNSFDAGADFISIVFKGKTLTLTDNGRGMGPDILSKDKPTIDKFLSMVEKGAVPLGYDVRDEIALESRFSIRWMMEFAGLSAKTGKGTIGRQGLAVLGARRLGRSTWYTRQDPVSARAYWGDTKEGKNPPVIVLTPATPEMIAQYNTEYTVNTSDEPLQIYNGEVLESGTKIVFHELDQEALTVLNSKSLVARLQARYGVHLREGARIVVTSETGTTEVEPPPEEGVVLISKTLHLTGGKGAFQVEIRWVRNRKDRRRGPALRFERTEKPLIEIADFNEPPFNQPDISGYVTFPDLPVPPDGIVPRADTTDYLVLTADKRDIVDGTVRNQWVKAIKSQIPQIKEELQKYVRGEREQKVQSLSTLLADATVAVLKSHSDFHDLVSTLPVKKAKPKKRNSGNSTIPDDEATPEGIEVVVYNQWNRRTHIPVVLRFSGYSKQRNLTDTRMTVKSGYASFTLPEMGRYTLRILKEDLPAGVEITSVDYYVVNVEKDTKHCKLHFNLKTPEKMPNPGRLPRFAFWFHAWPNTREPWKVDSLQEDWGQFEVNTASIDLRAALDADNIDDVLRLLAVYVASGICKHVYRNEPEVDLPLEISLLEPRLSRTFRERYLEKQRSQISRKVRVKP